MFLWSWWIRVIRSWILPGKRTRPCSLITYIFASYQTSRILGEQKIDDAWQKEHIGKSMCIYKTFYSLSFVILAYFHPAVHILIEYLCPQLNLLDHTIQALQVQCEYLSDWNSGHRSYPLKIQGKHWRKIRKSRILKSYRVNWVMLSALDILYCPPPLLPSHFFADAPPIPPSNPPPPPPPLPSSLENERFPRKWKKM